MHAGADSMPIPPTVAMVMPIAPAVRPDNIFEDRGTVVWPGTLNSADIWGEEAWFEHVGHSREPGC